ncbi:hypothetical protein GCM10009798_23370 [Nocardioides panacihumi]|uniref:Uncharacterized protein n=1 Tax=Nocardioides panacihumi TaxID=400774 RepID=A0ABN2R3A7_9ACTN
MIEPYRRAAAAFGESAEPLNDLVYAPQTPAASQPSPSRPATRRVNTLAARARLAQRISNWASMPETVKDRLIAREMKEQS